MSEFSLSDDELLSSHLDDRLSLEDQTLLNTRLAAEPDLRARLKALRGASELLTTPVIALHADDSDRLIAAALAASATTAKVSDLGAARLRKKKWRTRVVTAAAGVAALAIAVPVLRSVDSDSSDTATSVDADSAADEASVADAPDDDSAGTTMEAAPAADMALEAFDDADEGDDEASVTADGRGETSAEDADMASVLPAFDLEGFADADPDFDPLPDDLGDFPAHNTLLAALVRAHREFSAETEQTSADEGAPDAPTEEDGDTDDSNDTEDTEQVETPLERARAYLDEFGGCGQAIDQFAELLMDLPPVLAVDWSIARSGGRAFTVGLFRLPDEQGFAVVIDPVTCTSVDRLFLE